MMRKRASAARYAKALLDVAVKESDPEAAGRDLTQFAEMVREHPDLQRLVTDPVVSVLTKRAVVQQLLERLGPISPSGRLLLLLASRGRLELLPEVTDVYRELLRGHRQVLEAEVTTAAQLTDERATQLRQRLSAMTGQTVTMTTRVDKSILGGVVARIGGTVYDGSVATQLARVRDRLVRRD